MTPISKPRVWRSQRQRLNAEFGTFCALISRAHLLFEHSLRKKYVHERALTPFPCTAETITPASSRASTFPTHSRHGTVRVSFSFFPSAVKKRARQARARGITTSLGSTTSMANASPGRRNEKPDIPLFDVFVRLWAGTMPDFCRQQQHPS